MEPTKQQQYARTHYLKRKAEREAQKPVDPIDTLTPEELAYLAGLIDGEGTIYMAAVGPHRQKTVYPHVAVAMTHKGVMEWMAMRLNAGTLKKNNPTELRRNPEYRVQYRVNLFGKRAKRLCERLLPYLKVKQEQARIVTLFVTDARTGPGVLLPEELKHDRLALREQIHLLNHPERAV